MTKQNGLNKKFIVYYYEGDFFSSKGEKRKSVMIMAKSETEAAYFFKHLYSDYSFGWVEEYVPKYRKEKNT